MQLDPDNQVVKLCVAGMQAEQENRFEDARAYFTQAWAVQQHDIDACIAAHYMARLQTDPERILHWNLVALRHADAACTQADAPDLTGFYPSLYLNAGSAYEGVGDIATARHYYEQAATGLEQLAGEYGDVVRRGVAAGLRRTSLTDPLK